MSIEVPEITPLSRILPEEPLLMMGLAPANSCASGRSQWHRDQPSGDTMARVLEQVKAMACHIFQNRVPWVVGVAGPGLPRWKWPWLTWSGRRPRCFAFNGFFSNRLAEMAKRAGAK